MSTREVVFDIISEPGVDTTTTVKMPFVSVSFLCCLSREQFTLCFGVHSTREVVFDIISEPGVDTMTTVKTPFFPVSFLCCLPYSGPTFESDLGVIAVSDVRAEHRVQLHRVLQRPRLPPVCRKSLQRLPFLGHPTHNLDVSFRTPPIRRGHACRGRQHEHARLARKVRWRIHCI